MPRQTEEIQRLTKLRQRTLDEIARMRMDLQAEIEPAPASDEDAAADVAADIYERSKIISLIGTLEAKLHSVNRAMERAEQGVHGICEKCSTAIPLERLEIMPETTVCVHCAGERERGMRRSRSMSGYREPRYRALSLEDPGSNEADSSSSD